MRAASRGPERNPSRLTRRETRPRRARRSTPTGTSGLAAGCSVTAAKDSEPVSGIVRLIRLGMDLHSPLTCMETAEILYSIDSRE